MSPHILLDNDLDELARSDCPAHYEVLVMRNIAAFMQAEKITTVQLAIDYAVKHQKA